MNEEEFCNVHKNIAYTLDIFEISKLPQMHIINHINVQLQLSINFIFWKYIKRIITLIIAS